MRYEPHEYQKFTAGYIEAHPVSAIFLDCGLGKTSITLTAVNDLMFDSFEIRRVLVIAPIRVASFSWPAEIEKWDHLKGIKYSVAVGTAAERLAALKKQADIYLINRENVQWLITESGIPFDFDMVVVDELSSFKNHQTKRFKALMKVRPKVKRIVGLTGTPSSNGLMDLWAEFRLLDIDPTFYPVIYGADEADDWTDPKVWKKANPSLNITVGIDKVKAACESAKQNPGEENSFRQLRLNQWVKQAVRWMPMDRWDACAFPVSEDGLEGRICYGGLDLSWRNCMTGRKTGRGTSEHETGGIYHGKEPLLCGREEDHGQGTDAPFRGLPAAEGIRFHQ